MINKNKGFTLIELLIVVAVIGILASIVVVSLSDQTEVAQDSSTKLSISSLRTPALAETLKNPSGAELCGELHKRVSSDNKADRWTASNGICTDANIDGATSSTDGNTKIGTLCCASAGKNWVVFGRLSSFAADSDQATSGTVTEDFHCADSKNNFLIVDEDNINLANKRCF